MHVGTAGGPLGGASGKDTVPREQQSVRKGTPAPGTHRTAGRAPAPARPGLAQDDVGPRAGARSYSEHGYLALAAVCQVAPLILTFCVKKPRPGEVRVSVQGWTAGQASLCERNRGSRHLSSPTPVLFLTRRRCAGSTSAP